MSERKKNRIKQLAAAHGLSVAKLAVALDMAPHTLRRYTRHEAEPSVRLADKLAEYFNVSRDYVIGDAGPDEKTIEITDEIPVYGAAQGGTGFDVSDIDTPVDHIRRPNFLAGARDPYGVFVSGESMEPRFYPGEVVFVHPGLPARRGDWCVVQFRVGDDIHAIVKRYRSLNDEQIVLEQLNPAREVRFERSSLIAIHRIVGTLSTMS